MNKFKVLPQFKINFFRTSKFNKFKKYGKSFSFILRY
jgi:hypothetical protein